MSGLKTLAVLLFVVPMPGRATDDPLVSVFASCAGRFSAEMEHAWLMQDAGSPQIENRRRQFIDLLNATVPLDQRRDALNLRIDAKVAHALLLSQAAFSVEADRSEWAVRRARSEIAYCTGLLLES